MVTLSDSDVAAVIAAQRLCFAATVNADGGPNLSPKGTIRVWDATRLFFLDLASPTTVRNLRRDPRIEINVVDTLSRRGYRFRGVATLHAPGDEVYEAAVARIARDEGVTYVARTVVLIAVEEILPLWSPGYDHVPDEASMRELWKRRRAELDAGFEAHIEEHGVFRRP